MGDPSKTEKATPRRRTDARKKGQVAKSIEVNSAATFLAGIMLIRVFGRRGFDFFVNFVSESLKNSYLMSPAMDDVLVERVKIIAVISIMIIPFMLAMYVVAFMANVFQVGYKPSLEAIKPKFSKLNPIEGIKRLFSKRGLENFVKSLAKLFIIGGIVYSVVKKRAIEFFPLIDMDLSSAFFVIIDICYELSLKIALVFILLAIADFYWQKHMFESQMKMSKQEVKDEMKRNEGNPQIKGEIRRRMRMMMKNRMMTAVPTADVIVTNPTHIAVALTYDVAAMEAPKVVAKGAGVIAENIKDIAKENKVPIVENKEVARMIFQTVDVDDFIPEDMFQAVAEILTYVHKLTGSSFGL